MQLSVYLYVTSICILVLCILVLSMYYEIASFSRSGHNYNAPQKIET